MKYTKRFSNSLMLYWLALNLQTQSPTWFEATSKCPSEIIISSGWLIAISAAALIFWRTLFETDRLDQPEQLFVDQLFQNSHLLSYLGQCCTSNGKVPYGNIWNLDSIILKLKSETSLLSFDGHSENLLGIQFYSHLSPVQCLCPVSFVPATWSNSFQVAHHQKELTNGLLLLYYKDGTKLKLVIYE